MQNGRWTCQNVANTIQNGRWTCPHVRNPMQNGRWTCPNVASTLQNGRWTCPHVGNPMRNGRWTCPNVANTMQNDKFKFQTVANTRQMVPAKKSKKKSQTCSKKKTKTISHPFFIPSEGNNWGWANVLLTRLFGSSGLTGGTAQSPKHCDYTVGFTFSGRIILRQFLRWGYAPFPFWFGYV